MQRIICAHSEMPSLPAIMLTQNGKKGVVIVSISREFLRIHCVDGYLIRSFQITQLAWDINGPEIKFYSNTEKITLQSPYVR